MNLVASLICRNELSRYLGPCVEHLQAFCDTIRAFDDGSDDDSFEFLTSVGVDVIRSDQPLFFKHEGHARQKLLTWTLLAQPSHVLAIDADEFVADGPLLRETLQEDPTGRVWTLEMQEIWNASKGGLLVRQDGGWKQHPVPILYAVPKRRDRQWRINPKPLACGREPVAVRALARHYAKPSGTEILHFGWARKAEREARHQRYVIADGGRFHRSAHLDSIMWPDTKITLEPREWPATLDKEEILA